MDDKSSYRRQVVWRDQDERRVWKVEYYDRKDAHLKTLTMDNYAPVPGSLLAGRRDGDG